MINNLIAIGVDLGIGMAGVAATTAVGYFALRLLVGGMARKLKSTPGPDLSRPL